MLLKMYSIRDSKGEIFHPPYFKRTHGEAERDFSTLASDQKSGVGQYPEDYDLYYIGQYDDQTGKVDALATPQHVVKAVIAAKRTSESVLNS